MEIFVSAGDASSEMHAEAALKALLKLDPGLKIWGLGGDRLAALGAETIMHTKEFSVGGGPIEILSRLPRRSRLEKLVEQRLADGGRERPRAALLVDNGEINLRLASLLHFFKVPVIYYIPPKVWVWRSGRLQDIADHVTRVLSILPFERPIYEEWGIPFTYVGNPLLDEVPLGLTQKEAKSRLGIAEDRECIALLPGSRHSEIKFHTKLFRETVNLLGNIPGHLKSKPLFLVPVPPTIDLESFEGAFRRGLSKDVEMRFYKSQSHECLKASRAALIKSGTSTLEAAMLGVPMVITYQQGNVARLIFRHIMRYTDHVGLANLFLSPGGPAVAPEYILESARPEILANALSEIYQDTPARQSQCQALQKTAALLKPPVDLGHSPSECVAQELLKVIHP